MNRPAITTGSSRLTSSRPDTCAYVMNRPRAERRPLTDEEKAVRAQKRTNKEISKAKALLEALMAN